MGHNLNARYRRTLLILGASVDYELTVSYRENSIACQFIVRVNCPVIILLTIDECLHICVVHSICGTPGK